VKARRGTARLLLGLGALLLLLLAGEAALWATGLVRDPRDFTLRRMTGALQQDTAGRYVLDDVRAYSTAAGFRFSPAHAGRDATGEWPFRGRAGAPLPPAAVLPRVLVVGDSCVYGASLDACDTLGWQLAVALEARGLPPDHVAVIPLGVPGYSTEQILPLLGEGLAAYRPLAVVLYVAAWNDQAPALRAPDRALLAELAQPSALDWLRTHTRLGAALLHVADRTPRDEIMEGWKAGHPPLGFRVPEQDVEPNVRAMLAACRLAGALAVVIVPPHPDATLREHPRTAADAASVRRAAVAGGAVLLDAPLLLASAGGDPARFFCDYVHPSPAAVELLAQAAAEPVARVVAVAQHGVTRSDGAGDALHVTSVEPREAFALGDVRLHLELENGSPQALPAVLVGGAPLLDQRAVQDGLEGTLPANGTGTLDLVVQDAAGCSVLREALTLRDPEITRVPGSPPRLAVRARPGDRLRLLSATRLRAEPQWSVKGALLLGSDAHVAAPDVELDAQGRAEVEVPGLPDGRVYVQAMWAPAGEDPGGSLASRWTGVVQLGD
jgi:lysophospholipase L1-like esterase